jgi:cysteine desulfurase
MLPYFCEEFGDPAAKNHAFGWRASQAVDVAKKQIARLIGAAHGDEIVFTSGATESNNLAIKGVAECYADRGRHIITTVVEHKAVLDSCKRLERDGFRVTYLPVQSDGRVSVAELERALCDDTILVSIMLANNEVGSVNALAEIGRLTRARKVLLHSDVVQGFGKVPFNVETMQVDLASMTAHKIYGPKGVGALYVRSNPAVRLTPQLDGDESTPPLRAGTINVPGVVGFGAAARLLRLEGAAENARILRQREHLRRRLMTELDSVILNGPVDERLPGNLNVSFAFVEGEALMMAIKGVAVSSGSACTSASLEPSYVLRAMGVAEDLAHSSLRFGIGRFNTDEELDAVADLIVEKVKWLREMSPLYEMHKQGIDLKSITWAAH